VRSKTRRSGSSWGMAFLGLVFLCVASGCGISSTPAMKQNAGAVTDLSKFAMNKGIEKGSHEAKVLVLLAETNEGILGSPETRLPLSADPEIRIKDLKEMEENSVQAKKDNEGGGFWTGAAADAVTVAGWGLAALGLLSVGKWVGAQAPKIRKWKKKADKLGDTVASAATTATDTLRNVIPKDDSGGDPGDGST